MWTECQRAKLCLFLLPFDFGIVVGQPLQTKDTSGSRSFNVSHASGGETEAVHELCVKRSTVNEAFQPSFVLGLRGTLAGGDTLHCLIPRIPAVGDFALVICQAKGSSVQHRRRIPHYLN